MNESISRVGVGTYHTLRGFQTHLTSRCNRGADRFPLFNVASFCIQSPSLLSDAVSSGPSWKRDLCRKLLYRAQPYICECDRPITSWSSRAHTTAVSTERRPTLKTQRHGPTTRRPRAGRRVQKVSKALCVSLPGLVPILPPLVRERAPSWRSWTGGLSCALLSVLTRGICFCSTFGTSWWSLWVSSMSEINVSKLKVSKKLMADLWARSTVRSERVREGAA